LRLARLSRLARVARLLGREQRGDLIRDVVQNRSQYTAFITILLTLIVLSSTSVLVLQFESQSPDANIKSGWDSFLYSVVTITTMGYGDRYPVTVGGRITAMFIMLMGLGIIGTLASILSSILVGTSTATSDEVEPVIETTTTVEKDIAAIKDDLAALRRLVEKISPEAAGDEK